MTEMTKSTRFPVKVDDVPRPRKTVESQCSLRVSAHAEKIIKMPYKTRRFLSFPVIDAKREPKTVINLSNFNKNSGFAKKRENVEFQ